MILTPWTLEVSHGLKRAWPLEMSNGLKHAMAELFGDSSGTKLTQK